jgi:predicted MPP superfamily phosphohydrolase
MFFAALLVLDVLALSIGARWIAAAERRGTRYPARALLQALLWCALCGAAFPLGALFATSSGFAALRALGHALFCVGLPLLGWCGVRAWRLGRPLLGALLVLLCGAGELAYLWARRVEPRRLAVDSFVVEWSPGGDRAPQERVATLKIALLADLQTDAIGAHEEEIFRRLDEGRADLVLFAGDYLQIPLSEPVQYERERAALRALFRSLTHAPRYGFFGVWGDIDFASDVLEGTPVAMLDDAWAELPAEAPFQLFGLSLASSRRELASRVLARIASEEQPTIVLGHAPDFLAPLIERGDSPWTFLALAGHVHGGQVVLPWLGPPITLSRVPREVVDGSLQRLGGLSYVISRGLGMERGYAPRLRFACRPQLVFLELRLPT